MSNDLNDKIRIAGTVSDSIVDGVGIRYTIFTQGCPHHCEGCHNPQTHDFDGGYDITLAELYQNISKNILLDGVTFSGGEPFCQAEKLFILGTEVKKKLGLNIVAYSGYTFEYLLEHANEENYYRKLLEICDILVDGKFVMELKSYEVKFRGSTNQRIIDVRKSLDSGKTVETTM